VNRSRRAPDLVGAAPHGSTDRTETAAVPHEKRLLPLPDGVFAAALTPLRSDFSIDHDAFAAHCRWLLASGCDGVAPMGTTGEANSFSVAERIEALDRLAASGIPLERLLIGTGCAAIPDTVVLTRHAIAHGVGGVLVLPPFYYKNVSDDGLFAAFDQVIQRVASNRLKLYLYHFPQMSGVPLSQALIGRLVERYPDTVVGMKDSSGDWNNMKTACERFPGFRVYAGTETLLLPILRTGGAGCISATTNVTCALAAEVYAKRATPQAESLQQRLSAAREAFEKFPAIAALKRLTAERTGHEAWRLPRPPHLVLADAQFALLKAELDRAGFAPP
jgi:4-hydroxy-tetrahydrodipicolinate synthase